MMLGITQVVENIGIGSFENLILLIMSACHIVFFAAGFRKAIVIYFVLSAAIFMWFYEAGYNWVKALIVMLMTFVVMALTLYFAAKQSKSVGMVG